MSWNPDDPGQTVVIYLNLTGKGEGDYQKLYDLLEKHRFVELAPKLWGTTEFFYDMATFDRLIKEFLKPGDTYLGIFRVNLDLAGWKNFPATVAKD